MSSSVSTTTGGVVVVTHVHPTPQDGEPQRPVGIQKFSRASPMAFGTVQIMIGLMTLLLGIVMAINANTLGVFSGFFVWGALIYIAAGSLTVAAGKSLNRCRSWTPGVSGVIAVFNLLALIVSITVAVFCCNATCNCGEQAPLHIFITAEAPVTAQASSSVPLHTGNKQHPEEPRDPALPQPPPYTTAVN
ncbi:membrane-spanning 4-domains subfamily A member 15 isoform X8 [Lates calcarifer]|uniref:Membrane-spanning 4-domains subfamily A member 15 isoform X2 n=1 Tax=Lates calcarifer TaxID=8187 RepID=A0AAJ7Q2B9_LATCA|nr:membrane-spanning 4-domains subfamily A member 15 isoform X2 [Lates calcarifer]XP_050930144.1 membrane-spanning 4-domains subfamily A member 15 isoform X8 [Lates calcarifer]